MSSSRGLKRLGAGSDPSESAVSVGLAPSSPSSERPHRWTGSLPVFFLCTFFGSEDTVAGHSSEVHRTGGVLVICRRDEDVSDDPLPDKLPTYCNRERGRGRPGTLTAQLPQARPYLISAAFLLGILPFRLVFGSITSRSLRLFSKRGPPTRILISACSLLPTVARALGGFFRPHVAETAAGTRPRLRQGAARAGSRRGLFIGAIPVPLAMQAAGGRARHSLSGCGLAWTKAPKAEGRP